MAKTLTQIQKESDERRGMKTKAFKLPLAVIAEFERVATLQGLPGNALLAEALEAYKEKHGIKSVT